MLDNIQKEINGFYTRYAAKEGITLADAKKRVTQLDIDVYERKAKKYVADKTFSSEANEEMRLYNATMKINRLEMLKADIGLELVDGFDELQKYFDTTLTDRTLAEFKRQAGILGKSVLNNEKAAHAIVNASFQNAKFSDRIWMYQDMLKAELAKELKTGLIQGRNPKVLARHISKTFGVSRNNAERLMQTELARVQTEAQKQSYERNGYDQYVFIAEPTACPICQALDDKTFDVQKMMPGTNASPMHPHCRCSTAAYMDREALEARLAEIEAQESKIQPKGVVKPGESDTIKLSNQEVRNWYVDKVNGIKDTIDNSLPMEVQARIAFEQRNEIRTKAREMMEDEETRKSLDTVRPNKSFEELISSKMKRKGLSREEAIKDIYATATKTNEDVNKMFGIGGNSDV